MSQAALAPLARTGTRSTWARVGRALAYAVLGCWAFVCLFPLYWIAATSIKPSIDVVDGPRYLPFVDFRPSLESWSFILFNPTDDTLRRYANSVIVAFGSTGLTVVIGALAAYGLTRLRAALSLQAVVVVLGLVGLAAAGLFVGVGTWITAATLTALIVLALGRIGRRGKPAIGSRSIFVGILATRLLPPVVTVLPIYLLVEKAGLLDTRLALILTYTAANLPVAVWLLRGFLDEVPTEIEDSAQLDGASRFRILFTLFLPLIRGRLVASALLIFILSWNEYVLSLYLTNDHALTMPPFLAGQMATREQMASAEPEWGYFSVIIVLMVAPLVVFTGLLQRVVTRSGRT